MKMTSITLFSSSFLLFATSMIACTKFPIKEDPVKKIFETVNAKSTITKKQEIICKNVAEIKQIFKFNELQKNPIEDKDFFEFSSKFWLVKGRLEKLAAIITEPKSPKEVQEKLFFWQSITNIVKLVDPICKERGAKSKALKLDITHLTELCNDYLKCLNGIIKAQVEEIGLKAVISQFLEPVTKVVKFLSEIRTAEETDGKLWFKKDFVEFATKFAGRLKIIPGIEAKMDSIINLLFEADHFYPISPVKNDAFEKMLWTLLDKSKKSENRWGRTIWKPLEENVETFRGIYGKVLNIQIKTSNERSTDLNDLNIWFYYDYHSELIKDVMKNAFPERKINYEIWYALHDFLSEAKYEYVDDSLVNVYRSYVYVLTKALDQIKNQREAINFEDVIKEFLEPVSEEIKLIKLIQDKVEFVLKIYISIYGDFKSMVKKEMNNAGYDKNVMKEELLDKIIGIFKNR